MANAGGRLLGTVLSGVTYQLGGLALMLGTASAMIAAKLAMMGRMYGPRREWRAAFLLR